MSSITLLLADDHNLIRSGLHALLKLDELLRGMEGARTSFVNLESLSDEELDKLQREFDGMNKMKSPKALPQEAVK